MRTAYSSGWRARPVTVVIERVALGQRIHLGDEHRVRTATRERLTNWTRSARGIHNALGGSVHDPLRWSRSSEPRRQTRADPSRAQWEVRPSRANV